MAEGDSGLPEGYPYEAAPARPPEPPVYPHLALVPVDILTEDQLRQLQDVDGVTVAAKGPNAWSIAVYIDNGLVYDYTVGSMASAREHAAAIQVGGYRSVSEQTPGIATYYPVHRIIKVKVTAPEGETIPTAYKDQPRGT